MANDLKKIDYKNMRTRFISGIILLAIIFVGGLIGSWVFFSIILIFSMIGLFEFYRMAGIHKAPTGITGFVFAAALWGFLAFSLEDYLLPLLILAFFSIMGVYVFHFVHTKVTDVLYAFFGLFYVVYLLLY